jgi:sugar lactone lactonase YvrE
MSRFELVTTIPVQNVLGECILWDETSGSVWWTDIHSAVL